MDEQEFCLRWSNHEKNMSIVMEAMYRNQILVDVTLTCTDGQPLKAHRTVLSACSPYFETVFKDLSHSHPIIFMKDVKQEDLKALLNYMYKGEVNVKQNRLNSFIKLAEALSVRGLSKTEKQAEAPAPMPPCPPLKEIQSIGKLSPPVFSHPPVPQVPLYFPPPQVMPEKALHDRYVSNSILEESLRKRKRLENDSATISSSSTNNNEGSPCSAPEETSPNNSLKEKSLSAIAAQLHQKQMMMSEINLSKCPPFLLPPKHEVNPRSDVKTEYDDLSHPENSDELSDEESFGPEDYGPGDLSTQTGPKAETSGTHGHSMNGKESPAGEKGLRRKRLSSYSTLIADGSGDRRICKICGKSATNIYRHLRTHSSCVYRCLTCLSTLTRRDNMKSHIRALHAEELQRVGNDYDRLFEIQDAGGQSRQGRKATLE